MNIDRQDVGYFDAERRTMWRRWKRERAAEAADLIPTAPEPLPTSNPDDSGQKVSAKEGPK